MLVPSRFVISIAILTPHIKCVQRRTSSNSTTSSEGGPPPSFAIEKTIKAQFSPITSGIELDKYRESVFQ